MESMKHFASTKYNVSVITIFFFQQIYCVLYVTLEQHQNSNIVFYTFTSSSYCICLCNEHLSQSVYTVLTVSNKIYQISAFSQDKENVTQSDSQRKRIKCDNNFQPALSKGRAATELVKQLSC